MKFECKELRISDEEFGCTITFSDTVDKGYDTYEEIMNLNENYLLLQRTFPEDEYENDDTCYIELSDFEKSGFFSEFSINLKRSEFKLEWEEDILEITLKINEKKFKQLKKALKIITAKTGTLKIEE